MPSAGAPTRFEPDNHALDSRQGKSVSAYLRPSPKDTIKIGRKTVRVGDETDLRVKIIRIGPAGAMTVGDKITVRLPDGTLHTLSPRSPGAED